ncbi:hypothetical protein [Halobacterium rubrum]|nr:hypothetical protein [Halobacterium sp. TGN-42-S1]
MTRRFCGDCGARLRPATSPGGIPRRVCPNCSDGPAEVFAGP